MGQEVPAGRLTHVPFPRRCWSARADELIEEKSIFCCSACPEVALLGPRKMSDLSPQSAPKRWPIAARAQQDQRLRRIGWLAGGLAENDPESRARTEAFVKALRELGWTEGHNMRIEYRWGAANVDNNRKQAAELIALAPDVVLATASGSVHALQQASRTVPIVFVQVPDPVGAGFVDSLARPGGNATGFTTFEYGIGAKWLELLKEIAPGVKRAAVLRDPTNPAGSGQWGAIQSVAPSFGVELSAVNMRSETGEIERAVAAFARQPNSGLILTASAGRRSSSRQAHLDGRPTQTACYLSLSLLCRQWRVDLLRA
jgi:putative tryptophan/tyrosine transport system substrate-binding protein